MITFNRSAESIAAELEGQRNAALEQISAAVKSVRLLFLTDIPGQELIYNEKRGEAEAYLAQPIPPTDMTPYPFLAAEVGITGATAAEVAQVFLDRATLWVGVGSSLEAIRLTATGSVTAATTAAEIDAALALMQTQIAALA